LLISLRIEMIFKQKFIIAISLISVGFQFRWRSVWDFFIIEYYIGIAHQLTQEKGKKFFILHVRHLVTEQIDASQKYYN